MNHSGPTFNSADDPEARAVCCVIGSFRIWAWTFQHFDMLVLCAEFSFSFVGAVVSDFFLYIEMILYLEPNQLKAYLVRAW